MKFRQIIKPIIKRGKGKKLLSKRVVLLVQKLYARGMTMREAAARAGIALGSVHKILSGSHPNQTETLEQIKKEESRKLYKRLREKKHKVFPLLPPFYEISWMRMKGRFLLVESIIAERVNGVLTPAGWVRAKKAEAAA